MKGVRSLCIICSLDFTNGVNEEEENKLPSLFAKIWKVFCHHFKVSTSSSSKSKYDEIFNYFFSISELPFCNNCRNDAAELLILHEKCQKIQEKMREVKSRISVTIVNSSKSAKLMPNVNKDAPSNLRLKAGTESLKTVNEDAKDSSKNHNDASIFDEVLCNEQVNELIHHMRLQIVENYNPQIVLLDVNGQSRDNNEKTNNHKISRKIFQKDVHNEYDVDIDRHDNSSPFSILNEESPSSPVLLNSYDDEKDEEDEIHSALSNNLFGSLINCQSLNEIKVESGSTNIDNSSTPNPSGAHEETTIDEEPSYASPPHQLEEEDFQNVNIVADEGEETPSKLPLVTSPHFQIDHHMGEDDEDEEEEEQECDPLALDLKPDPGQLTSRIKEEPVQEYHDNYAPLSPHEVTFEATVQVPKPANFSASQPLHNPSSSSSNNAHDPETPDLSTSFRQSVAMTQSVSRSILPPSTPSGIPLRYIAKAAIKSGTSTNNSNNNSKSVSLGYVLVPAKMVSSSVSGSAAAAVASSSSSLSSSSSVKDLVKIKRGRPEKNDCVKTYAPAKSSKGQGQVRDAPIKITRKRPVGQVKSKVKSVSRDKEQMRRSGERQNLENLAKLLPRFKYLNNPKEGQFLPSKISILQKAKQYIEELGKLERNLANQEKKAKTQNNNLKIQIALLSAKNVKTLKIVKSNHLSN